MDYAVVESDSIAVLTQKVNGYIEIGWQPIGGVASERTRINGPVMYFQAVLKNGSAPSAKPIQPIRYTPKKRRIRRWAKKPAELKTNGQGQPE